MVELAANTNSVTISTGLGSTRSSQFHYAERRPETKDHQHSRMQVGKEGALQVSDTDSTLLASILGDNEGPIRPRDPPFWCSSASITWVEQSMDVLDGIHGCVERDG